MRKQKLFISIAGNIGIGKSTLTTKLSERFGWKPFYEVVDTNPYLADFYNNMKRWSFHLQIFFLSKRFQHHKQMIELAQSVIQDRSIYEDVEIFAKGLWLQGQFDERDYRNYVELFECMTGYLRAPDLMIGLSASMKTLKNRIERRGRECEKSISTEYLQKLNKHYESWYQNYDRGPLLMIDTEHLDIVNRDEDFEFIVGKIKKCLLLKNTKTKHDTAALAGTKHVFEANAF